MTLDAVDLLFNMLAMLFWVRIWDSNRRIAMFNPYLAGVENFTQPVMDFISRGLPTRTSRLSAGICWLFLMVFRGLALPMTNPESVQSIWRVRLGFEVFTSADFSVWPAGGYLIFSLLSFAVFVFHVWSLALIYSFTGATERPTEFFHALSAPISGSRPANRAAAVVILGAVLTILLSLISANFEPYPNVMMRPAWWFMRGLINSFAGIAEMLSALQSILIILIIGSWISLFTGGGALSVITREWLDYLLGPFRRFPVRIGIFDLTPIIAFFALGVAHFIINGYILRLIYLVILNA